MALESYWTVTLPFTVESRKTYLITGLDKRSPGRKQNYLNLAEVVPAKKAIFFNLFTLEGGMKAAMADKKLRFIDWWPVNIRHVNQAGVIIGSRVCTTGYLLFGQV
jgi:hypothetical protein